MPRVATRTQWLLLVVIVAMTGSAIYLLRSNSSSSSQRPADIGFPGPYRVVGNQILSKNDVRFIPHGFVLECLAKQIPVGRLCSHSAGPHSIAVSDQITAARTYWDANTIRLQVSRKTLFSLRPYDAAYLSLVESVVKQVNKQGMVAIVTLQEEECCSKSKPLPDATSVAFWKLLASRLKNEPAVFFDLFNEPRLLVRSSLTEQDVWHIWQDGGAVDSRRVHDTFVGMQALVNVVRATGARNVVIAESNHFDTDMSELSSHYLHGPNIAYGIEPNLLKGDTTATEWATHFGNEADKVPVLSEAFLDNIGKTNCNAQSPTLVPRLMAYVQSKGMGLLVWTLAPGLYIEGDDLDKPTTYNGHKTVDCKQPGNSTNTLSKARVTRIQAKNSLGPGRDLLELFRGQLNH